MAFSGTILILDSGLGLTLFFLTFDVAGRYFPYKYLILKSNPQMIWVEFADLNW